jgi:hypothetical protein
MNNAYTSKDFYLSAYLVASGFSLQTTKKVKQGLTYFTFNNSNELIKQVSNYYSPDAVVHPAKYGYALKTLKGIIRQPYSDEIYEDKITEPTTIRERN